MPHEAMTMPAKCPDCPGDGSPCEKCGGTGRISVIFPAGTIHAKVCRDCKGSIGGCIVGPGLPPLRPIKDPCVFCGSSNVGWANAETGEAVEGAAS